MSRRPPTLRAATPARTWGRRARRTAATPPAARRSAHPARIADSRASRRVPTYQVDTLLAFISLENLHGEPRQLWTVSRTDRRARPSPR
jgi:hypothetical protein